VHGDYRLDNCMLDDQGRVAAVLDWELCTLGDPLADLGLLCVYWADPGEPTHSGMPAATTIDGFATKADLVARYADLTGRDVSRIGYYVAFGYWKLACIIQGVFARYSAGAMGDQGDVTGFDVFGQQVEMLAEAARAALDSVD
jgi:aminoglycoside phosphotransferase (APT) family kinase protein